MNQPKTGGQDSGHPDQNRSNRILERPFNLAQTHVCVLGSRETFSNLEAAFGYLKWRAALVWVLRDILQ